MKLIQVLALMTFLSMGAHATDDPLDLQVYKTSSCGCCKGWIKHADQHGFGTEAIDLEYSDLTELKQQHGIKPEARSCHTAVYKGQFVFEGHVPAKFIEQFINNPPKGAIGLSVPQMPVGTPGMEVGDRFDPYKVIQLNADGSFSVYATVEQYDDQF